MKRFFLNGKGCWVPIELLISALLLSVLIVNMTSLVQNRSSQTVLEVKPQLHEGNGITLPYAVEGTTVVVKQLAAYDGPFIEDESNAEVTNIAALVLYNYGEQTIEQMEVVLLQGKDRLQFYAETILPDTMTLVLETNKMPYKSEPCADCIAYTLYETVDYLQENDFKITELGLNCISIQNLTGKRLENIKLYHKSWLLEPGIFVGGVATITYVGDLEPQETVLVYPQRYASGYSKVLQVKAE